MKMFFVFGYLVLFITNVISSELSINKNRVYDIHEKLKIHGENVFRVLKEALNVSDKDWLSVCCGAIQSVTLNDDGTVIINEPKILTDKNEKVVVATNASCYQLAWEDIQTDEKILAGLKDSSYDLLQTNEKNIWENSQEGRNIVRIFLKYFSQKLVNSDTRDIATKKLDLFFYKGMLSNIDKRKYSFDSEEGWSSQIYCQKAQEEIEHRQQKQKLYEEVDYQVIMDDLFPFLNVNGLKINNFPKDFLDFFDFFIQDKSLTKHAEPLFIWWLNEWLDKNSPQPNTFYILHLYSHKQTCSSCETLIQNFTSDRKLAVIISFKTPHDSNKIIFSGVVVEPKKRVAMQDSVLQDVSILSLCLFNTIRCPLEADNLSNLIEVISPYQLVKRMFSTPDEYLGKVQNQYTQPFGRDIIIPDWIKRLPVQFQIKLDDPIPS